jgi:hypothetical protein
MMDLPSLEKLPGSHSVGETTTCAQVKEHIEMLHQTAHSMLLFAKNNIIVHKDSKSPDGIPGYLSLHQFNDQVILKWTPNFLVWPNPDLKQELEDDELSHSLDLMVSLDIRKIVSIHCHKQADESEQTQLIAQDGRQFPPFIFPPGGSLTSFLIALETGLLPHGRLNPPLWARRSQKDNIFPTRRKSQHQGKIALQPIDYVVPDDPYKDAKQASNYYVFHVIHGVETGVKAGLGEPCKPCKPLSNGSAMDESMQLGGDLDSSHARSDQISLVSEVNGDSEEIESERSLGSSSERLFDNGLGSPIQNAYEQIMQQIKSRAFYGWLSHVRHMSYLRKHLLNFVSGKIIPVDIPTDATSGVTAELWETVLSRGDVCEKDEVLRLTYYGGIDPKVRSKVWPYLIGHYDFGLRATERALLDMEMRTEYKSKLDEWTTIERELKKQTQRQKSKQTQNDDDQDGLNLSNSASLTRDHSPVLDRLDSITVPSREPSLSPVQRLSGGEIPDGNDTEEVDALLEDLDLDSGCEDLEADSSILQQHDAQLIGLLKVNLDRIDKDVVRCDRNHPYFQKTMNLVKLRNVLVSYIWDGHLNPGYIQGMCDIVAPLLVAFDDEALVWSCFQKLMVTLAANFNASEQMDMSFSNLRALLRVMDPDLYELLHEHDCTHLFFTHRWFLIDFKREFGYDGIFLAWEVMWSAAHSASQQFRIFLALALLQQYKHILLDNEMGFTDITKFFNEMAEKHDIIEVLQRARQLTSDLYNELHCGNTNVQHT